MNISPTKKSLTEGQDLLNVICTEVISTIFLFSHFFQDEDGVDCSAAWDSSGSALRASSGGDVSEPLFNHLLVKRFPLVSVGISIIPPLLLLLPFLFQQFFPRVSFSSVTHSAGQTQQLEKVAAGWRGQKQGRGSAQARRRGGKQAVPLWEARWAVSSWKNDWGLVLIFQCRSV